MCEYTLMSNTCVTCDKPKAIFRDELLKSLETMVYDKSITPLSIMTKAINRILFMIIDLEK